MSRPHPIRAGLDDPNTREPEDTNLDEINTDEVGPYDLETEDTDLGWLTDGDYDAGVVEVILLGEVVVEAEDDAEAPLGDEFEVEPVDQPEDAQLLEDEVVEDDTSSKRPPAAATDHDKTDGEPAPDDAPPPDAPDDGPPSDAADSSDTPDEGMAIDGPPVDAADAGADDDTGPADADAALGDGPELDAPSDEGALPGDEIGAALTPTSPGDVAALIAPGPPPGGPPPTTDPGNSGDVAAFQGSVSKAVADIPPAPIAPKGPARGASLSKAGVKASQRHGARRKRIPAEGKAAVPKPKKVREMPEIPAPDPIPAATNVLKAKSKLRLHAVQMPDLAVSPLGNQPRVGRLPLPTPAKPAKSDIDAGKPPKAKTDSGKDATKRSNDALHKPLEPKKIKGEVAGLRIEDTGLDQTPELPKVLRADVASVLARLLAQPGETAKGFIRKAVETAYPQKKLAEVYPNIGDDLLGRETTLLLEELEAVRVAAKISKKEIDKKVAALEADLYAGVSAEQMKIYEAEKAARTKIEEEGKKTQQEIADTKAGLDLAAELQKQEATGKVDPEKVKKYKDARIKQINDHVGMKVVQYDEAGKQRKKALVRAFGAQAGAYNAAAKLDREQLLDAAGKDTTKVVAAKKKATDSDVWANKHKKLAQDKVIEYIRAIKPQVEDFQSQLRQAGKDSKELVRDWAAKRLGRERSWWQRLHDWIFDYYDTVDIETSHWEKQRAQETTIAIAQDSSILAALERTEGSKLHDAQKKAISSLGEQQKAVIDSYYNAGPDKGNPVAAVAKGLAIRLSLQRRPKLIEHLKKRVNAKPGSEWRTFAPIARVETSALKTKNAARRAYECWNAFMGAGTEEEQVYAALAGLTPLQGKVVNGVFKRDHGRTKHGRTKHGRPKDLHSYLKDEMSGAEKTRANALLKGDSALADAAAINYAIDGFNCAAAIKKTLRNKTPEQIDAIKKAYKKEYTEDLGARLAGDLGGMFGGSTRDSKSVAALLAGDEVLSDAIDLDQALRGGWFGADKDAIKKKYETIRADVTALGDSKGWNTKEINKEIKRRSRAIEEKYDEAYGKDFTNRSLVDGKRKSALRAAFDTKLTGGWRDMAYGLADNDQTKIDRATLTLEDGSIYSSDKTINKTLADQYERELVNKRRDLRAQMRKDEADHFRRTGKWWTTKERAAQTKALEPKAVEQAQEAAKKKMKELRAAWKEETHGGSLDDWVESNTSGVGEKKAKHLLAEGGFLSDAKKFHYALEEGRPGSEIQALCKGKTKSELDAIAKEWQAISGNKNKKKNFFKTIQAEYDGDEGVDVQIALMGEPENAAEWQKRARIRLEHERKHGQGGREQEVMEERYVKAAQMVGDIDRADKNSPEYTALMEEFDRRKDAMDSAIGVHRFRTEQQANFWSTVASVAATVAVLAGAVVVSVFSGGTATGGAAAAASAALSSIWVAGGAAVAGAAATVITKRAIKGKAYTSNELTVDLAFGVVDAVMSVATAGMGGKLVKGALLGKAATEGGALTRMAAHGLAEATEGFLQSAPSALVGNALDKKIWQSDNPLASFVSSTLIQAGMGTVLSGAMGSLGGIGKPKPEFDFLAVRNNKDQADKLFDAYKVQNPGMSREAFDTLLDEAAKMQRPSYTLQQAMKRQLRDELLQNVPAAMRGRFKNTPIEMLSDAEFEKLTGSQKGKAVTMFRNGRPTVVVRAGTDLSALGEEGVHLLQSTEKKWRKLIAQLDERKLARWDSLSVDEKLKLYRTKVIIELDAQERLMETLAKRLDDAGLDDVGKESVRKQMTRAEVSFDNLKKRLEQIDKLKWRTGEKGLPDYLRQKPRLFNKGTDSVAKALDYSGNSKLNLENRIKAAVGKSGKGADSILAQIARLAKQKIDDPDITVKIRRYQVNALIVVLGEIGDTAAAGRLLDDLEYFGRHNLTKKTNVDAVKGNLNALRAVGDAFPDDASVRKVVIDLALQFRLANPKSMPKVLRAIARIKKSVQNDEIAAKTLRNYLKKLKADLESNEDFATEQLLRLRAYDDPKGTKGLLLGADRKALIAGLRLEEPDVPAPKGVTTSWKDKLKLWTAKMFETKPGKLSEEKGWSGVNEKEFWELLAERRKAASQKPADLLNLSLPANKEATLLWRWRSVILEAMLPGTDFDALIRRLVKDIKTADFDKEDLSNDLIRYRIRQEALDTLPGISNMEERLGRLQNILDAHPKATKGGFFMWWRRTNLGEVFDKSVKKPELTFDPIRVAPEGWYGMRQAYETLKGKKAKKRSPAVGGGKYADGVVEVVEPFKYGPSGSKDKPTQLLVDDKAGPGAFDKDQADIYVGCLIEKDGLIGTQSPSEGLMYLTDWGKDEKTGKFAHHKHANKTLTGVEGAIARNKDIKEILEKLDQGTAEAEVKTLLKKGLEKVKIYVGYYDPETGRPTFLPRRWIDGDQDKFITELIEKREKPKE